MSVLVKGMEMPTEGTVITIYKLNGKFYASVHGTELCPLVPVPPHGRLIDADELMTKMIEYGWHHPDSTVHEFVEDELHTVIPADKDGET